METEHRGLETSRRSVEDVEALELKLDASVRLGMAPLIRYGRAPKKDITIQPAVTIRYPSFFFKSLLRVFLVKDRSKNPAERVIPLDMAIAIQSFSQK